MSTSPMRRWKALAKQLCNDETQLIDGLRKKGLRVRMCANGDMCIEPAPVDESQVLDLNEGSEAMGQLIEGAFGNGKA